MQPLTQKAASVWKCDGNHGAPQCGHKECWLKEAPMPDTWDTRDGQTHDESELLNLEAIKVRLDNYLSEPPAGWTTRLMTIDLPACVAEIERLRGIHASDEAAIKSLGSSYDTLRDRVKELEEESLMLQRQLLDGR